MKKSPKKNEKKDTGKHNVDAEMLAKEGKDLLRRAANT